MAKSSPIQRQGIKGSGGSAYKVAVQIHPSFRRRASSAWLRRAAQAVLSGAGGSEAVTADVMQEVGVVVADDETVRELNRRYRGLDEVTDVLSFSPFHSGQYEGEEAPPPQESVPFPAIDGEAEPLGEVVIALEQAERQAAQAGHSLDHELAILVVHGVLHLLGHDHVDPLEEQAMLGQQRAALARLLPHEEHHIQGEGTPHAAGR